MRYPRNVKIFRGGVDAAPFAGLFFASMLFMVLLYSHVFFPGVPVTLSDESETISEMTDRTVSVLRNGGVRFFGEDLEVATFERRLAQRVQKGDLPKRIVLEAEPGANAALETRVENLLKESGVGIKLPGARLDLPEDAGFTGAANPVIVVGINLNGQIFFQHQLILEGALQGRLADVVEKSGGPLTLVLQADKNVPYDKIIELSKVARKAGITRLVLGTRPGVL